MSEHVDTALIQHVNQQLGLLMFATQRRRLAAYLRRLGRSNGAHAPSKLANRIAETRAKIARITAILRSSGGEVADHPDDEALPI